MAQTVTWFEIPVLDAPRAKDFYEKLFGEELEEKESADHKYYLLPGDGPVGGALVKHEKLIPSPGGVLMYLNAGDDLQPMLERADRNGGRVLKQKEQIDGRQGYFAVFVDPEGNRIGLHSEN